MELDLAVEDVAYIMNAVIDRVKASKDALKIAQEYDLGPLHPYYVNVSSSIKQGERIIDIIHHAASQTSNSVLNIVLTKQLNMALKTLDFENCDPDAVSKDAFQVMAKGARCRIAEIAAKASLA